MDQQWRRRVTAIALCIAMSDAQRDRLLSGLGDEQLVDCSATQALNNFVDCEVAFGDPPPAWLETAPVLRWVQLESVGFGEYAGAAWTRTNPDLKLTNLAEFFSDAVAETALAGILSLGRGIDELARLQARREWVGDPLRSRLRLLRGATGVMVGNGAINRRLAELLTPFNCQIIPFRRGFVMRELDDALPRADVVICAAPDTPETRDLFDVGRLSRIRRGAIFVNLGRGSIVDETALACALTAGALAGAVIDVTRDEPLP